MTVEELTVRRCAPDDLRAVLALWQEARSGHASIPDRLEDLKGLLGASPAVLLVAEGDGEIVGTLVAGWDGWRGNLYRLAVRADRRRTGIGMELTRAGEDYLRGRGARRVTALVARDDDSATGFWDAAGYPVDEEIGRRVRNL